MYCIIKDLYNGNKNLPEGFEEELLGHNAIAGGFQGQRQWTDHWPDCDYPEAILNSTFDHNGPHEPYIMATENDVLNGLGMLFMKLLTGRAQIFADVRTYWSPEATKKATGYDLEGKIVENGGIIHLMNNWGANHGAISYGHVGAELITMCSMLRIPVCMHNVPTEDIFRPAAWNAFGMDKEGQDYRACQNFGPMYK